MRMRRLAFLALVGLLPLGLTACGDDDDAPEASGSPEASEEGADFCGSLRTFHETIFQVEVEDDATAEEAQEAHDELAPKWDAVTESAPDDHQDVVEELGSTIDALAEGDVEPFNADETAEQYFGFVADVVGDCVDETNEVTAIDYAFEGVPQTIPSGESGLILVNDSEKDEEHELILFRKAEGETRSAQELLADPALEEEGPGEFSGAVFAGPGERAGSFVDLQPGDYVGVCFIPVGGGEEGPPHFTEGMVTEFTVE